MFIIHLLIFFSSLLPAGDSWQRINTNQHISFLFPNKAQTLTRQTNGIDSHIYQTKNLICVFGIVCSDFSSKKMKLDNENVLIIYEQMKNSSLGIESAILKNERTVPYENMLIKEIEYSVFKNNFEMTYYKRFIFRDNFVYQISIGGKTRHSDVINEEKDIFFNSINFHD